MFFALGGCSITSAAAGADGLYKPDLTPFLYEFLFVLPGCSGASAAAAADGPGCRPQETLAQLGSLGQL
eukprot:scaffold201581_cov17-Tisochrysis_lutea.AAC.1